jgi:hypothetical protein
MGMPLPAKGEKTRTLRGKGVHLDDPIKAPLTGRMCLAYKISVLFDAPRDARPPQWVLMESWGNSFRVGDTQIEGNRIHLETPLGHVSAEEHRQAGLDLPRFLRERGLFFNDGSFDFFEAIVTENDEIEVLFDAENRTAIITNA